MASYRRILVLTDIAAVHREFVETLALLARAERDPRSRGRHAATRRRVAAIYAEYEDGLVIAARKNAIRAEARMKARFDQTRVKSRGDTGHGHLHLRAALRARPADIGSRLATGAVGIADVDELNKVVNPASPQYGPFWRAQEFGTGSGEVPSQLGRVLHGYFFGRGYTDPTRPIAGANHQPIFVSARNARTQSGGATGGGRRGGSGGMGTIKKEIKPRHFIAGAIQDVEPLWIADMKKAEGRARAGIRSLLRP